MSDTAQAPDARTQLAWFVFATLLLDPEGRVIEANHAAEELLGRSASRLTGMLLLDLVSIEDRRVAEALEQGDAQMIARGLVATLGGKQRRINLTSSPIASHTGWRAVTLAETGQGDDPDDRERVELRAPAVLAHEIKNPLSAIRGASQLLAKRLPDKDRTLARMISGEVDRIAKLIDRMQQLGSETSVTIGPCNLHEAIRNAMGTVRAARPDPSRVELVEEFDPSLPPVHGDQGALEQVLINLLANACDASNDVEGAQVTVRTRYAGGLAFSAIRFGKSTRLPIEITVTDSGPGLAPELAKHAFEPFVTSKPHGQGLGLALVRKLVRDMGGHISHERDTSRSLTHFRINLPVADSSGETK